MEASTVVEPQSTPICATEPRFCLQRNVHLHLSCPLSEDDFELTDANDRRLMYFKCNGYDFSGCFNLNLSREKFLRDNAGVTVINMKRKKFPSSIRNTDEFNIFAGETRERHICKLIAHYACMRLEMSVEFSDSLNDGIKRELILKSDLITDLRIYLGQPKQGGLLLARMVPAQARTALWSAVEFHIEISANVDIAMTVMFCIEKQGDTLGNLASDLLRFGKTIFMVIPPSLTYLFTVY